MKKINILASFLAPLFIVFATIGLTSTAYAITCPDGSTLPDAQADQCPEADEDDGDSGTPNDCVVDSGAEGGDTLNRENCKILDYLVTAINTLSVLAGVVIVGSLIFAGIQYSMAASDPSKVSAAKGRIRNAVIALLLFLFGYGLLEFLVPGGVLP